jgi:hypothetical protein
MSRDAVRQHYGTAPEFPQMAANLYRNLAEGRAGVIALVGH